MYELEGISPDRLVRLKPEDAFDGGIRELNGAFGIDNDDAVARA